MTGPGCGRRPVGPRRLRLTELGFGSAPIAGLYRPVDPARAGDTVRRAWESGVRYFDTAPHYGLGVAERRLGAALADRARSDYVLSTKVGRLLEPNPEPTGSDLAAGFAVADDLRRVRDYSRDGVRRSIDASLARLGTDRIDIVYVHDPDDAVEQAIDETIPALVALREQGVIGAVGVGMNQWRAELRMVAETDLDIVMIAGRWTLLDRSAGPLLDRCRAAGVGVAAAAPFNSGLLARDDVAEDARFDYAPARPGVLARARALAAICRRHGVALAQAALQFPLRHPGVTTVVAGFDRPEHVDAAVEALARPVPEDVFAEIDRYLAEQSVSDRKEGTA